MGTVFMGPRLLHYLLPIKPQLPNLKSHLYTELRRALGNTTKKWKRLKQVQIWAVAGDLLIWEVSLGQLNLGMII